METPSVVANFSADVLRLDAEPEITRIVEALRDQVLRRLRRRGVVIGLSGGIDSSVCAALCVRAFGPRRVLGLFMPEQDSDPESLRLGRMIADALGISTVLENIRPVLEAAGCYERRDHFIRRVVPDYGPGWKCKLALTGTAEGHAYNIFYLTARSPDGLETRVRLPLDAYLGVVAATSMKQRTRKQIEYYHADRLNFAVVGTPNRLEYDQGFFVKNGDGAADVKPIAHLYKTQVYEIAAPLGVPDEIRRRPPTTDTYSLPQTQEEFYFSLSYELMDVCLYGVNHCVPADVVARATGLTVRQVERINRDIVAKRRATEYQHERPLLVEPVLNVGACP